MDPTPKNPERFYERVAVHEGHDGFEIRLDGRRAKTREGSLVACQTQRLGEAVADEWRAQAETIDPATMPLTGLQATVIDLGAVQAPAWRSRVVDFVKSDLLCYRAEEPASLAQRQAATWDPYLDWFATEFGEALLVAAGIGYVDQSDAAIAAVNARLADLDEPALLSLRILSEITGSGVLALNIVFGAGEPEAIFEAARVDEEFQIEKWGRDAEADARVAAMKIDFDAACRFFQLSRP